MILKYKKKYYF